MVTVDISAAQAPTGDSSQRRWAEMLGSLLALLPDSCECVLVDGLPEQAALFTARLQQAVTFSRMARAFLPT